MRYLPLLLLLITLMFSFGCEQPVELTFDQKCAFYKAKWKALDACRKGNQCRLTDREHSNWRQHAMLAIEYCELSEYNHHGIEEEEEDKDEDDKITARKVN